MNDTPIKKSRREKINIMLNEEERKIIKEKAKKYGYGDRLAEYVRDACIYEKIYVEDIKGKQEICKMINDFIIEIRKIQKFQLGLDKKITLSKDDILSIKSQNEKVSELIEGLTKSTIATLSTNSIQKFQQRIRLVDKHKLSEGFIDMILSKDFVIIMPSKLSIKNIKKGYVVIYVETKASINIDCLNYNNYNPIFVMIDSQRELALNNNCYLLLKKFDNELRSYLVYYNQAKDIAVDEYKKNKKHLLYEFSDNSIHELKEVPHTCN